MIAVPVFDVDSLRQVAEMHPEPPQDATQMQRQWRQLVTDLMGAADHIEICEAALMEARGTQ